MTRDAGMTRDSGMTSARHSGLVPESKRMIIHWILGQAQDDGQGLGSWDKPMMTVKDLVHGTSPG
jgi:hypothetical protein